jgi:hypothetical protein
MASRSFARIFTAASILSTLFITGCLDGASTTGTNSVKASNGSGDPLLAFLEDTLNIPREMVYVSYVDPTAPDALSGISTLDSAGVDTLYMVTPPETEGGIGKATRRNSVSLRAKTVRELRERWNRNHLNKGGTDLITGAKKAHTRWDYWDGLFDVKSLIEVNKIKVYIWTTGPGKLGPNWQAAVRSALANWNAQAKGSAVSFVETYSSTDHDVSFRGSYGIGPDGSNTSTAVLTPDELVEPDGISLWVNTGYENPSVPHNQKTTVAMSLLALATNIGFTGMEGFYWNMGTLINIPGTPVNDGDPWTPGSSVLTYGTTSYSTPNLTAGDIKALTTLYPTHGITVKLTNNNLSMVGQEGYTTVSTDVNQFQTEGDTLLFTKSNGYLYRRIGVNGSNVQIWPGYGSSGTVVQFRYSRGYFALTNSYGNMYTKTPTGSWVNQNLGGMNYRIDGERVTTRVIDATFIPKLQTKYLVSNPSVWTTEWTSSSYSGMTDFSLRNGLLVIIDAGNVYVKQGTVGTMTQIYDGAASAGPAQSVKQADQIFAIYHIPPGSSTGRAAVHVGGIPGGWWYGPDQVNSVNDIDVCNDKFAYLEQGYRARVIDFTTWTVYEHFTLPNTFDINKIQLRGGNCEYVTVTDYYQNIWAKYGQKLETNYLPFQSGVAAFPQ